MRNATIWVMALVALVFIGSESVFGQFVWTKDVHNPVLTGGVNGSWNKHLFSPSVLYNSDSARYEMWFAAAAGVNTGPARFGFAVSKDGINWSMHPTPVLAPTPGTWDQYNLESPTVIRENGQYKMWYIGYGSASDLLYIGHATSTDGINWNKHAGNPVLRPGTAAWEAGAAYVCTVMPVSGGYKMWYTGYNADYSTGQIGIATSVDGATWNRDTVRNPVFSPGASGDWDDKAVFAPIVLHISGVYYMWYTGWNSSSRFWKTAGIAVSQDGVANWTRYSGNPVTSPTPGAWDGTFSEVCTVLLRGDTLHMWYDGSIEPTETNLFRIGHATSPVFLASVRRVPLQYPTIQAAIDASSNGDTVLVSDGTYNENIRFKGKKIVVASTYLTTSDTSHISRTVIDGGGAVLGDSASVVYFISGEDTNSVLCGFTVRGGKGTSAMGVTVGGGVLCVSGARLVRNIITGNTLSGGELWGGGVDAENGQMLIMEQNIVAGNTLSGTWAGGAGVEVYNMKAIIRNNTIVDNTVTTQGTTSGSFAGGINCEVGTFTIDGNLIARNRALAPEASQYPSYGGGVLVREGNLDFRNNRLIGNVVQSSGSMRAYGGGLSLLAASASELTEMVVTGNYIASNAVIGGSSGVLLSGGGGIFSRDQRPRIENNIIVKNTAPYGGGFGAEKYYTTSASAINTPPCERALDRPRQQTTEERASRPDVLLDAPFLINNTIAYNRATVNGGAIATSGAWTPTIMNTIAWGDTGTQEMYIASGGSISVQYSDVQGGFAGTGNINAGPLFVSGDSLYDLQPASPCIGRGADSLQIGGIWYRAPAWDYDGHPRHRPLGPQGPDMGAQEEQVTVDVTLQESVPLSHMLGQNYPNPFNPSTTIRYGLPQRSQVTLSVFNTLGQQVTLLQDGEQEAGYHEVTFEGSGLSSGVYFYRLRAGDFVETMRLLLLR